MIEVKISQGAKPGHGGMLPASKVTEEIASIRHIPMGQDCMSPPSHSAFGSPQELMKFCKQLRQLSGGKPVGIKVGAKFDNKLGKELIKSQLKFIGENLFKFHNSFKISIAFPFLIPMC